MIDLIEHQLISCKLQMCSTLIYYSMHFISENYFRLNSALIMTDELELPLEDILKNLHENYDQSITMEDLRRPSADTVQKIYVYFLFEFGLSDNIVSHQQPDFLMLEEIGEHVDMFKRMLEINSMLAACITLLTELSGNTDFGLSDLLNPTPKRTHRFLSNFLNFWIFCDAEYPKVDENQGQVEELITRKKIYAKEIENYKENINRAKGKSAEEAAEADDIMSSNTRLEEQLMTMTEEGERLGQEKNNLKMLIEEEDKKVDQTNEELKKKEREKNELLVAVEGAATIAKVDEEIQRLKEDRTRKQEKRVELRDNMEQVAKSTEALKAILETGQSYSNETDASTRLRSLHHETKASNNK